MKQVELVKLDERHSVHVAMGVLATQFRNTYPSYDDWQKTVIPEILNGNRLLFEIVSAGKVCGLFLVHLIEPPTAKANALVIFEESRGDGLAKGAYLKLISDLASEREILVTQVKSRNVIARTLVEEVGFSHVGRIEHLVEDAIDNEAYARSLRGHQSHKKLVQEAAKAYNEPSRKNFVGLLRDA